MYLGLGVAALFLLTAAVGGLQLSIRGGPAIVTFAGALSWVRWRHDRPGGEERLATGAGVVLVLAAGGFAGGLICLVGQTFARPFIDPFLYRADLLLGVDTESVIRGVVSFAGLPVLLAIAYTSSFPLIFVSVLTFAWTGRGERAWELCGVFNLCLLIATVSSAIIPATGPFHYLSIAASVRNALPGGAGTYHLGDLFALRRTAHFVIDPSQLQGVAVFPSFHAMLALMTAAAWRDVPRISVAMCAWQAIVILSAIPIGGHYIVDLLAGGICWVLVHFLWQWAVLRSWGSVRASPCRR
jgi:membrane-associated phospholipid phosphatase